MKRCTACRRVYDRDAVLCPVDGASLDDFSADPLVGQTIAKRYRLARRLGTGYLGAVYLATELATGKQVALKLLAREIRCDEEALKQCRWDARFAAASHPSSIARVFEVDRTDDGQVFIAMEYVDGVSLADVIHRDGRLEVGRALRLASQIAQGLAAALHSGVAYVSNQGDKTVAVVDTVGLTILKRIPVGTNPHFLILGPDGRVWGCNTGSNDIYVIDPGTQQVVASFQVGPAPQQIAIGFRGLAGPLAYVTVAGFNKVLVLDADVRRLRLLEEIDVGDAPNGIAANPQGTRLFVVHERSNDLRVIDTGTSRVIATVPVGRKPIRVVVSK